MYVHRVALAIRIGTTIYTWCMFCLPYVRMHAHTAGHADYVESMPFVTGAEAEGAKLAS